MRKNIRNVLTAWLEGRAHTEKSCSTDGETVFSYGTAIAARVFLLGEGFGVLLNTNHHSPTTSTQQSAVRAALNGGYPWAFTRNHAQFLTIIEVDLDGRRGVTIHDLAKAAGVDALDRVQLNGRMTWRGRRDGGGAS